MQCECGRSAQTILKADEVIKMLKTENFQTYGWESAIRGMRNPMNSWKKSDSIFNAGFGSDSFICGPNDLDLMKRLRKGGPDDRKYLRQIFVSVDITAPLYWWKEMDQYKVGTVTNSCSTMHKIHAKEFEWDDFSFEHLLPDEATDFMRHLIDGLNYYRQKFLKTKDKKYWWQMIQLLPSSYNQKRTWTANYEVLCNIYHARKNHKLDEWHTFCDAIENLPYAKTLIIGGEQE